MTIYKLPEMTVTALPDRPLAVALGNFDGVHRGHQRLLSAVREIAARIPGCVCAVWSFTTLAKDASSIPSLTTTEEKLRHIAASGVQYAILENFEDMRSLSPETFAISYLYEKLHCAAAVCGFNYRFGKGGAGDADLLSSLLSPCGCSVTVVPPVVFDGRVVSSTRIRAAVAEGDMEQAAALLGRPFSICLPVVHGRKLGRTIGLPTVNQTFPEGHIIPLRGIYACACTIDGCRYPSVSNVGVRPTVSDGDKVNCETHIIGYNGDLYGESIRVEFYRRLRDEMKFSSVDELKEAIEKDILGARSYFENHPELVKEGES
ncbi:MAG: bifunctional riboflavin kinase/FAD synthetase [Clostridia bacterium]|nr:bifunctional riboflavin kinase/FAD synthetase [Clostridia bacterium]